MAQIYGTLPSFKIYRDVKKWNAFILFCYSEYPEMRRNLPPLNALLAFEAAARHGNFTRAATELSVAQPAVTRQIAKLESWLGTDLFNRHGNSISLTSEGQDLAEIALAAFDRLELGMRDIVARNDQDILIGASFGVAHLWLMPRISGMRLAANATVNFLTSDDYRSFDGTTVDCSIRFGNGDFGSLCHDLLFGERCQIIASPAFLSAHPEFDQNDPIRTLDPKYMLEHGDPHANGWATWAAFHEREGHSLPGHRPLKTILSYPTMLDMVCAGEGVGIGYWGLEDHLVKEQRIVRVGQSIGRKDYGYYLVYRKEMKAKRSFLRLREFLQNTASATNNM